LAYQGACDDIGRNRRRCRNNVDGSWLCDWQLHFYWHFATAVVAQIYAKAFHPFLYWITIVAMTTLGTTMADLVFAAGGQLSPSHKSHILLFWAAFILMRPLGATLGDLLDKPQDHGGLEISRYVASGILAVIIVALIPPARAGVQPGAREQKVVRQPIYARK